MATVNPNIVDALIAGQLDLLRLEAGTRNRTFRLLTQLERDLSAHLSSGSLTRWGARRVRRLLRQANEVIEDYFTRIDSTIGGTLRGAARAQSAIAVNALSTGLAAADIGGALPSTQVVRAAASEALIMGASTSDWWERQASDIQFRFAAAVREGILQGETGAQIAARVTSRTDGLMATARRNIRSLVHSSLMTVANNARRSVFQENDDVVKGIRQVSTLDSHTTEICMAYDGAEFDLDGNPINDTTLPYKGGVPRHWGCRSVEVPITKTFKELGLNIREPGLGDRASADGLVPASTTFEGFLDRMGEDFQNEVLGPGRAQLWRDGDITLQQLLDLRGNPLTLAQLERRYS